MLRRVECKRKLVIGNETGPVVVTRRAIDRDAAEPAFTDRQGTMRRDCDVALDVGVGHVERGYLQVLERCPEVGNASRAIQITKGYGFKSRTQSGPAES